MTLPVIRLRRDRHWRGTCGRRGGVGRGAHGPKRGDLHAVGGDGRAHALQPGGGRHGEGTPGSRDRRARRLDGPRRSTRLASSSSCSIAVADRPCGRRARRPTSAATASGCTARSTRSRTSRGSSAAPAGIQVDSGGVTGLALESGEHVSLPRARRDDGHVSQWAGARGPRAAAVGPRWRAAIARPCGVDQVDRIHVGAAEDRDAAAARSPQHRLLGVRAERGDDPPVPFSFTTERIERDQIECSPAAHERRGCTIWCGSTSASRRSSTVRSAALVRATARRSRTR